MLEHISCVGFGFDVHAFDEEHTGAAQYFYLAGVKISHSKPIKAHSDGDILFHALTDAILGAIGGGSIGEHFPPSHQKWRNCSSAVFVQHALGLMKQQKGKMHNVDCTIICQNPKIMPYAAAIKESLAIILSLPIQRINVKAVTTEWLGFIGRGEGIAVQVGCMISLPS